MNSCQYRIFVCTKQRSADDPEGCCCNAGAIDIYQTFKSEIDRMQLNDRIEVRQSGCLDRCEAGAVALVCQIDRGSFNWLPTKLRVKLRHLLFPHRHLYGSLTTADIPEIVQHHLIEGKPLKRCQINTD
jgi:(2Fe-2S) ferredoxin